MLRAPGGPAQIAAALAISALAVRSGAHGADRPAAELSAATPDAFSGEMVQPPRVPTIDAVFLQYGVAIVGEFVATPGAMCSNNAEPCVLGSGGGITARVGFRPHGRFYFGGAYELTKQDPATLLRLAILQQLRGEARYYLPTGRDTEPYFAAGAGLAAYGNEGGFDTTGPCVFVAVGIETQISRSNVVGGALAYRMMYFTPFDLSGLARREASFAHIFGLEMTLEVLDPR